MASIFQRIFARDGTRMDQNDWAAEMMAFQGNMYPLGMGYGGSSSDVEKIENDFEGYIHGAYKSDGIVFGVMLARSSVFCQVRFQYQRLNKGRPGDLFGKPELSLLEKPWNDGTTTDLLARAIQDVDLAGNFYAVTEGVGGEKRLRRLRPDWTDVVLTAPPDQALKSDIAGYVYRPGNTQNDKLWEKYPIDGSNGVVVHWAPIPDPEAQYRGMSWLTPVLTDIKSDRAIVKHKQKFFENAATPSISISLKETVTYDQFKKFRDGMERRHAGVDNAYKTLYLGGGADVKVIGSTLQEIDFTAVAGHGETRICMAGGVHPTIVGVAENMHGATLNQGNFTAAKNMFIEKTMIPLWISAAQAFSVVVPELAGTRLWYDDRDIPFLRQDRKDVAELKQLEATTMTSLISAGFTPDSVVIAMRENDWRLLKHTGLFSVQLVQPGTPLAGGANQPGQPGAPTAPGGKPSGDANTPDKPDQNGPNDPEPTDDPA